LGNFLLGGVYKSYIDIVPRKSVFIEKAPEGYVTMKEAKSILGVSRQTVLQHVKRGELKAVHVRRGKQIGLYIKVLNKQIGLF
jgi:excisionase family DNA binding protein